jgi:hypothetical protein
VETIWKKFAHFFNMCVLDLDFYEEHIFDRSRRGDCLLPSFNLSFSSHKFCAGLLFCFVIFIPYANVKCADVSMSCVGHTL